MAIAAVYALAHLLGIALMRACAIERVLTFAVRLQSAFTITIDFLFTENVDWKLIETHLPDMCGASFYP